MKLLYVIFSLCLFSACSTKKVTEFNITNNNNYPISVKVTTNNVSQTFAGIKAGEKFTGLYDWTTLEKKEGQWVFRVQNDQTKGADEFTHGYYTNGELFNYVTLDCKGDQLKVQISE